LQCACFAALANRKPVVRRTLNWFIQSSLVVSAPSNASIPSHDPSKFDIGLEDKTITGCQAVVVVFLWNLQFDGRRRNPFGGHGARECPGMLTPATLISALEETMERRFDTTERPSGIDQRSLAERLAEIRELRRLVREAEARRRQERRPAPRAPKHLFEVRETI
jgi:hypothetical protein